jgi:hypothetical protein
MGVYDATDPKIAKVNPTIDAVNDFLISINDGAWETLDNAPTITPAGSEIIKVVLSAAETTAAGAGGSIVLRVADASDSDDWIGGLIEIPVRGALISTLTASQVNDALTTSHGVGSWQTATGFATPGNVTTAQAAITSAIDALNDLSMDNLATALATYDGATQADLTTAQAAIISAIDALNDLSSADVRAQIDAAIVVAGGITVVSVVSGSAVTMRQADTWRFTINATGLTLTAYTNVGFAVKAYESQDDDDALLHLRSTGGLIRIDGAAPVSSASGSLTVNSDTSFTVVVNRSQTVDVAPKAYRWYLKVEEADTERYTLMQGRFDVIGYGIEEI